MLVWCILSLTNGYWSCRGMPGRGIPDIGMLMVAANWALGVVSPLLGQALLVGIVLPTPGQALLWALSCPCWAFGHCQGQKGVLCDFGYPYGCWLLLSIFFFFFFFFFFATGTTHRAVVATGCWHCYCWLPMALFFLAVHGIIFLGGLWHYCYLGGGNRGVAFCNTILICALQHYI